MSYYAGNEKEKKLDDQLREAVRASGGKAEMALFIQNQEILSMLRRQRDNVPYGYTISTGYKGFVPGMGWIEFPTEEEYNEYLLDTDF